MCVLLCEVTSVMHKGYKGCWIYDLMVIESLPRNGTSVKTLMWWCKEIKLKPIRGLNGWKFYQCHIEDVWCWNNSEASALKDPVQLGKYVSLLLFPCSVIILFTSASRLCDFRQYSQKHFNSHWIEDFQWWRGATFLPNMNYRVGN